MRSITGIWGLGLASLLAFAACKDAAESPKEGGNPAAAAGTTTEAAPVAPTKTVDPTTTATVSGVVTFAGTPPAPTMIRASSDAACSKVHPSEFDGGDVLVRDGKVENAFVWVKSGLEGYAFPAPTEPVKMEQLGCMYKPRLVGARTNQEIIFTNDDPTMHNVSAKPKTQKGFNIVTPVGQHGSRTFSKPEVPIRVGCDVHPWMSAYIGVLDHPVFAITGADGTFALKGLPPGSYTIAAWHERLGTIEQTLTIAAREAKTVALALPGAKAD
ncbi:carboxypeptidase regulatory-like domain-containing protein [Myxococcota bacterium]|nr:carboxypeptidase regulatory-like domain-containing protein [Myxococcota bacterium]